MTPLKTISLLMAFALAAGCSDPLAEQRQDFIAGCSRDVPAVICECAFEEIEDKYSVEEIAAVSRGTRDDRLAAISQDTLKALYECRNVR
jgi:hypothetical protein